MKILNWVFGSFFRTMGRFLFYLAIGVAIAFLFNGAFISNVSALTYNDLDKFTISTSGQFISLNSASSYTNRGYSIVTVGNVTYALPSGQPFTYGTYGGAVVQCDLPFVKDNFYALTYYFLSSPGQYLHPDYSSYPYQVGVGASATTTYPNFYAAGQSGSLQHICDDTFNSNVGNCLNSFTTIFKAPNTNTCVALKFSSSTHDVTTSEIGFVGYTYTSLGSNASSQDINNALAEQNAYINSLFTSTNNKIDSGFSDISQQQQQTNNKLDDLNDNITSEDSPKLDGLNNSAGWLPPGPVDSILNLPLSLLENITDNLGKSCQPINVNLPYVNETLTLPCISSIYSQIEGLSTWVNFVGTIASAFILLSYFIKLYKWVDDTLTFRENNHLDNWGGL